ncbi:MAG: SH3 domain-containing C40 family peptidase, partial [Eubacteriales bacterium]
MKQKLCLLIITVAAVLGLCSISTAATATTELKTAIGIVDASGLRLRAKPSTDAEIISNASLGEYVVVLRQVGDWYLVDYNLDIGYMSAEHVVIKYQENIDLGPGMANASSVNVRSLPDSGSELLAQMSLGNTAEIIGFNYGWYKVEYNGVTGYVRSDLMELTEIPATNGYGGSSYSYTSTADQLVSYSKTLIGTPYIWGGTSTNGFDCSGYVQYVFSQFGVSLNRTSTSQYTNGYSVSNLTTGDLVFF